MTTDFALATDDDSAPAMETPSAMRAGRLNGGPGSEMSERVLALLRDAMRARHQVFCTHVTGGLAFCPHALGYRADGYYVLAFLVFGLPHSPGLRRNSPARWVWLKAADISGAHAIAAPWWSGPPGTRPSLPGLSIEEEVAEAEAASTAGR